MRAAVVVVVDRIGAIDDIAGRRAVDGQRVAVLESRRDGDRRPCQRGCVGIRNTERIVDRDRRRLLDVADRIASRDDRRLIVRHGDIDDGCRLLDTARTVMTLVVDRDLQLIRPDKIGSRRIDDASPDRLCDRRLRAGKLQSAVAAIQAIDDCYPGHNAGRRQRSVADFQRRQQNITRDRIHVHDQTRWRNKRDRRVLAGRSGRRHAADDRRVVHRRDIDGRRGGVAGQRPARPGIAVVVHRQAQGRAGAGASLLSM